MNKPITHDKIITPDLIVTIQGHQWKVLSTGVMRKISATVGIETLCHLASTTEFKRHGNGKCPNQTQAWIPGAKYPSDAMFVIKRKNEMLLKVTDGQWYEQPFDPRRLKWTQEWTPVSAAKQKTYKRFFNEKDSTLELYGAFSIDELSHEGDTFNHR